MIERYSRSQMKLVWSDQNKYDKWLAIEIAVCEAWTQKGLIPEEEMVKLRSATYDFELFQDILQKTKHDMTAFLQSTTAGLGNEGRWLHQGLTTSDVWDTATSLQLVEAGSLLDKELSLLETALKEKALKYKNTLMMGRTHGVHAEPITLGLKIALWWDEIKRGRSRLTQGIDSVKVGKISGPVGTHATAPPEIEAYVCSTIGLTPAPVSNQVIQRDRHAHFVTTLALVSATLEKIATEIRGLQRTEIREVEEFFSKGQKGSSAMPHKRNPILTENLTGLARMVRSAVVPAQENIALWHERDISHSSVERMIGPDATITLDFALNRLSGVIENLLVYPDNMEKNLDQLGGLIFSQRVLLALTQAGVSREDSYLIVQRNAMKVWEEGAEFLTALKSDEDVISKISPKELEALFDINYHTKNVNIIFSRVFGKN